MKMKTYSTPMQLGSAKRLAVCLIEDCANGEILVSLLKYIVSIRSRIRRDFPRGERKRPEETDNGSPSVATMTGSAPTVPRRSGRGPVLRIWGAVPLSSLIRHHSRDTMLGEKSRYPAAGLNTRD